MSWWSSVEAVWSSSLLRRALVQAVLVGALGGIVGVHVSLRRLSFTTMAMTHATFPGVVLAALAGWNLVAGSALFGIVVVLVLAWLGRLESMDESSAAGVVLAGGIALGVVLSSVQDGSSRDLAAYLVGSIVTTTSTGVATTVVWGVAICLVLALLHRPLVASAFDPTGCQAAGLAVPALDVAALLVVMASIAVLVPAVGTILSVSLLVAPAATARLWTDRLRTTFVLAPVIGAASGALGIVLSHRFDTAAGATIAVVGGAGFALSVVVRSLVGDAGHWWAPGAGLRPPAERSVQDER